MSRPDFVKYRVSGKIVKLFGRDSVSTDTAALFELVKNAYDADASTLEISFTNIKIFQAADKALRERYLKINNNLKSLHPEFPLDKIDHLTKEDEHYAKQKELVDKYSSETKIIIQDNGSGMSLDQLINKWMVVGVDKTESELFTKKKRRVVGEKGVGRFAAEKLAKHLTLKSFPRDSKTCIIAEIDWEKFRFAKSINDAKIPLRYERKDESKHGLTLELKNLRENWSTKRINSFINELSVLILPEKFKEKNSLSVQVKIDGKKEIISVESNLFKKAPYYFVAELTTEHKIRFLEAKYKKDQIVPNIQKKDYELQTEWDFSKGVEEKPPTCGPVKFTFYGYPFDPSGRKLGWTEYYGKLDIEQFQTTINDISGIKIYRDGFRVRPYGDRYHDWLSMSDEARRTAGRLPSKSVLGWIEISSDTNKTIADTTSREKIIENESFNDLRLFANQVMDAYSKFVEKKRQEILKKEALSEVPKLVKNLGTKILDNPSIPKKTKSKLVLALNRIQIELTDSDERAKIEKESLMDEKNAFRNLASLGIVTGVVSHETNIFIRNILAHSTLLQRELNKDKPDKKIILKHIAVIDPSTKNLLNYMKFVKGFTATLGSRKKEFRKKQSLNLKKQIEHIFFGLAGILKEWDISYDLSVSSSFPKLRMFEADLQSVLLNLTSNSMKSLKHFTSERVNVPKNQKNKIKISAYTTNRDVVIIFSDNGLGIPFSDRSNVFELFWTRTASRETSLSGSGLGLPIIKEIIADYNGSITIEDKSELRMGVTFKITLPKYEVTKK